MTRQDEIRNLLRSHHRRLQVLKEQQAKFGLHTPAHIIVEIEDTEAEIEALQAELKAIQDDPHTLTQRIEQQQKRIAAGLAEIREQTTGQPPAEQSRVSVVGRPPVGVVEHFKNRVREQEKIGQLLAEPTTRLVSVIGHGGMGKTALASKVLRDLEQHRWPHTDDDIPLDGIVYLSTRTAGVSLERLFLDCAKMLGGEQEKRLNTIWTNPKLNTEEKISRLLEMLKEAQYVILLDNLEDLLDDGGRLQDEDLQRFFDQSLATAHGARLLVTSRVALAFRREVMRFDQQVKLLEGLPIADGVALLRELDPNSNYGLQDAPEEQLIQAVELVHGVPRALEVIAGILANDPFVSLTEVMAQFYEQEDVVEALIEENYKRLDDNARRVIEALAVFRRPAPSLAVDYLLEPFVSGLDVPDIIRRLTHTSIISVDRANKTIILHPIDQDYAYSQLPEEGTGEPAYTRQALERQAADYYVQLRTPPKTWKTIDDLEPQLAEFEHRVRGEDYDEACRVLESIDFDYLFLWGHYARLIELQEKFLSHLTDRNLQAYSLGSLGRAYRALGQFDRAIKLYDQSLVIARAIGDRRGEGKTLGNLGRAYHALVQFERAVELYEEALAIARETGDRREESTQLGRLGVAYRTLGRGDLAVNTYEEALVIAREIGDRAGEGRYLGHLGSAYRALGQFERAINLYEDALAIARETGHHRAESIQLGRLGISYGALGQFDRAIDLYEEALTIARVIGDRRVEGIWLGHLGVAYRDLGQVERAIEIYEEALTIARQITDHWNESDHLGRLGRAYCDIGRVKQAIKLYKEALAIARKTGDYRLESYQLLGLSKVLTVDGEFSEARHHCTDALVLNVPLTSYQAVLVLGIALLHQDDPASSEILLKAATRCQTLLDKTSDLYAPRYTLATALVGQAICNPLWTEENKRPDLLTPALTEYQQALEICDAPGVVQDALHDLELIRSAGVEGLEPVFELLEAKLV